MSRGPLPSLPEEETSQVSSSNTKSFTRRLYLSSIVRTATAATAAAAAATFLPLPRAALAEVARGDSLPQGAEQFQRLLVLKSDVAAVIRRLSKAKVSTSSLSTATEQITKSENDDALAKIDDKEWDALSEFMRKVYKGGDDMKSYTKGGGGGSILGSDKEKKEKAEEYAKLLQKIAQAGDGPISKKDVEGLMGLLKKAEVVLQDFFELLRDVPDEI